LSAGFSVKIRREVKEKMERCRDRVNWAEEVRGFFEETIRRLEAEENFEGIVRRLEGARWQVPGGYSAALVREDRGSG